MNEYWQMILFTFIVLGVSCTFLYFALNSVGKRIEKKLDDLANEIHLVVENLRKERIDKAELYNLFQDSHKK